MKSKFLVIDQAKESVSRKGTSGQVLVKSSPAMKFDAHSHCTASKKNRINFTNNIATQGYYGANDDCPP